MGRLQERVGFAWAEGICHTEGMEQPVFPSRLRQQLWAGTTGLSFLWQQNVAKVFTLHGRNGLSAVGDLYLYAQTK